MRSPFNFSPEMQKLRPILRPIVAFVGIVTLLHLSPILMRSSKVGNDYAAEKTSRLDSASRFSLNEQAQAFTQKVANIERADECFPVLMFRKDLVDIQYLYCSQKAWEEDGRAVQVTSDFSVAEPIARRFHFWRRVYSLWSVDQWVMHVAEYPEVILEVGDGSSLPAYIKNDESRKQKTVTRVMAERRREYLKLFHELHRDRNKPIESLSPAAQRIALMMAHIENPQKYMVALRGIRFQRGQRDYIAKGITTSSRYMQSIAEAFVEEGLPSELSRLAFIESSFNLAAYSKVGAAGVYQIMPATGRQYMLVGDEIDERRDPIKSAHAAAKLLKLYYNIIGEWPLAITAYNHGVGGIKRAIRETGSSDIVTLIQKYDGPAFGFASKNFYTGFLGMLATIEDSHKIFPNVERRDAIRFKTIRLERDMRISDVKKTYNLSNETLADFNPDIFKTSIRNNIYLPRKYRLKIPDASADTAPPTLNVNYEARDGLQ